MKQSNITSLKFFLFMLICIAGLVVPLGCREKRMSESEAVAAFKRYVLDTIPPSVTNIRADQPKNFGGYRYTFRFNISRNDLKLLTDTGPFVKVWNMKYENGRLPLQWNCDGLLGTGPISGMPCYDHTHEPAWFKLEKWANPEVHAAWKEGDAVNIEIFDKHSRGPTTIKILIYNEKEAEAYFIVHYSEK